MAAVAVTGKPYIFCVGADLNGVAALQTAEQARAMAERGHAVFARLRTASVPTFAFINGAAMGGGLELALHCHYRTISSAVRAVALPETFLGLVPGWGGATLVPRLIGPDRAVQLIIENPLDNNRMMRGPEGVRARAGRHDLRAGGLPRAVDHVGSRRSARAGGGRTR